MLTVTWIDVQYLACMLKSKNVLSDWTDQCNSIHFQVPGNGLEANECNMQEPKKKQGKLPHKAILWTDLKIFSFYNVWMNIPNKGLN
jgi:hypothetical protein